MLSLTGCLRGKKETEIVVSKPGEPVRLVKDVKAYVAAPVKVKDADGNESVEWIPGKKKTQLFAGQYVITHSAQPLKKPDAEKPDPDR